VGWKGVPGTNTLANYEHSKIREEKSFRTLTPRAIFTTLLYYNLQMGPIS